jgi:5-(carboxyamino)imidazole ribonucleotide mutase
MNQKIVILMGSKSDLSFARKIEEFIEKEGFMVKCEYSISSAHRTPNILLKKLKKYENTGEDFIYITIAGLSDALSGIVAAFSTHPVIACPPDIEKWGFTKTFSSVMTPKGVPVLLVTKPENAALSAIKILALKNPLLQKKISLYIEKIKKDVIYADEEISGAI